MMQARLCMLNRWQNYSLYTWSLLRRQFNSKNKGSMSSGYSSLESSI